MGITQNVRWRKYPTGVAKNNPYSKYIYIYIYCVEQQCTVGGAFPWAMENTV